MEAQRGSVVRSLAGHDKGEFLVILSVEEPFAILCDGKHRPLERPKRKKLMHLALTATVMPEDTLKTNRKVREALRKEGYLNVKAGRN